MKNRFVTKIVTVALILSVVIVIFPLAVSAEINTPIPNEIKTAFANAINCYSIVQRGHMKTVNENGESHMGIEEDIIKFSLFTEQPIQYSVSTSGKPYETSEGVKISYSFYPMSIEIEERKINTYSSMINYIGEFFTDKMLNEMVLCDYIKQYSVELFRPGANDELLVNEYPYLYYGNLRCRLGGYTGALKITGDKALLGVNVNFRVAEYDYEKYSKYFKLIHAGIDEYNDNRPLYNAVIPTTVELTKTDSGWKVSGGEFFKVYTSTLNELIVPQTGSPTPIYLTLAGAAILCALPVVKRKRRI